MQDGQLLSNIPQELRAVPQWVCWRYTTKDNGQPTKTPVQPRYPFHNASSTNPDHWGTYEEALACLTEQLMGNVTSVKLEGLGFVFTEEAGFVGVDFDDCLDGTSQTPLRGMNPQESVYLRLLDSYAEVSPSKRGFKVIFRGTIPEDFARRGFGHGNGIYSSGRFFTITGDVLGDYRTIKQVDPEKLDVFLRTVFPPQQRGHSAWEATDERLTDGEVLSLASTASNGEKFKALWRGDWESLGLYDSQSSADMALVESLAFYTGPVPEQIDRLFRQSGLFRDKWDEQRGNVTYGERTIERSLDNMDTFFTPKFQTTVPISGDTGGMKARITVYGPVTQEALAAEETDEALPVVKRKEAKKAWQRVIEGFDALREEEMPYWLARLTGHLQPLGKCFVSDWLEMSTLGFWSALWGGKKFENLPLNIWTIGISKQGTGKSVVADELDAIAHAVNYKLGNSPLLRYSSGSASGLIRRLEGKGRCALAYFSEWTGFAKGMDAEHSSSMREVLLNLYDGRNFVHQLATETIAAQDPFLVINGLTTPDSWAKTADPTDMGNGLYSRFLMFMPDARKQGFVFRDDGERLQLVEELALFIENLPAFNRCVFQAGTEGPQVYQDYYRDVLKLAGDEDEIMDMDDALLEADEEKLPTGRQAARVKKVAALLELMEEKPRIKHDTLFVRNSNVEKAIRLVQRGAGYTVRAFSLVSRSRDEMDAARVRRAIEKFPNVGVMGILRATGLNRAEVMRSLEMLQEEGLITSGISGGRRVYYMGGAE